MKAKITAKLLSAQSALVKRTKTPLYIWCSDLTNFGAYISKKGKITYIVQRAQHGTSKSQRVIIGHAQYLTLPEAQLKARTIIAQLANGQNAQLLKQQEVLSNIAQAEQVIHDTKNTLASHITTYLEKVPTQRKWSESYLKETTRIFNKEVIPTIGPKPVTKITKKDLIELIENKEAKAPVVALHLYQRLNDLFDWLYRRDLVEQNYILKIDQPKGANKRERVLNDQEIIAFWCACNTEKFNLIKKISEPWQFGKLHQLALLTMARLYEVTEMEWSELDLEARTWTIPSHKNKSKREHLVHLCPQAIQIIKSIPRTNSKYLFASELDPNKTITGHYDAKLRIDELMCSYMEIQPAELKEWVAHDLRRTAATKMQELGIDPMIIELCANRKALKGTSGIYQRHQYLVQRKEAFERLGAHVEALMAPKPEQSQPDDLELVGCAA